MKNDSCCPCSVVPVPGLRMLTFPDGSQAGVVGLDKVFEEMGRVGRLPNLQTASEIVDRLSQENYVAPGVRPLYEEAVLCEYRTFFEAAAKKSQVVPAKHTGGTGQKKTVFHGLLDLFRRRKG